MGITKTPYGTFVARWTEPTGRRTSQTFKTKADARAHLRKTYGDIARGVYTDRRRGKSTVAAWADDWLAGVRNLSRGGHDTYRRDLDRHILPKLGRVPLGKLTRVDIDRYLSSLELSPSTVHRHYRTLHRMLAVAVQSGMIARNPCEHVQPPRVSQPEIQVLDAGQVDALAAAITPRYRAWVYVMAYGALRWSESVGLRRGRVSLSSRRETDQATGASGLRSGVDPASGVGGLDNGTTGRIGSVWRQTALHPPPHTPTQIAIVEQLVHRGRGEWERTEPKAGSRRVVTLPDFVNNEMVAHLDAYSLPGDDGLVFPTRNGTPIQAPSFRTNIFRRALDKAGLPPMRVHDLRHTAVSLAIEAGANPKLSQARAGHSSIGIHLDRYGHLFPGADESVAQALDELHAKVQRGRLRVV
jgi:integrase